VSNFFLVMIKRQSQVFYNLFAGWYFSLKGISSGSSVHAFSSQENGVSVQDVDDRIIITTMGEMAQPLPLIFRNI